MRNIGILLIVLGVIALIYSGFTYKTKENVAKIGPLEVNKEKTHSVNWSPIAGGILVLAGVILMVTNKKD